MKFYHATTEEVMKKIITDGVIKSGWNRCVYLCREAADACKFLAIRGIRKMVVVEIELDEDKVAESHDHAEHFFRCKAYIHHGDIKITGAEPIFEYTFDF